MRRSYVRPRDLGQELVAGLEELVLELPREAKQNCESLGPTAICQRAGIYLNQAASEDRAWVGAGILSSLEGKGLVCHPGKSQWIIAPDEGQRFARSPFCEKADLVVSEVGAPPGGGIGAGVGGLGATGLDIGGGAAAIPAVAVVAVPAVAVGAVALVG